MAKAAQHRVQVTQAENQEVVTVEIIAQSIAKIAAAFRALEQTRLSRRALVLLLHDHSKVPRRDIELVLNNLEALDEIYLK